MSDMATNPYDAVAYPGHAFAQTHPARLAAIAHFHGMEPAPSQAMRVLELGCGRGGNLIPMAAQYPGSAFVGIDLSGSAIAEAKRATAEIGLENVVFHHRDILAVGPELGIFDYILIHGVYSWVPDAVREAIMALIGGLLAPQGVAYVSYNALPGCRLRDLARDVMLYATRDIAEPTERVRVARASLEAFAAASDGETFHGAALRQRLRQLADTPDNVLYHDDLNPIARAFALHEVLDTAQRHGLQFLAEASFPNMFAAAKGPAQAMIAAIPAEQGVLREQTLDLLIGRAFRETLLCREGIPLRRFIGPGALAPYHVAAHATLVEQGEDARPGIDRFEFEGGVRLSVDLHLCKAALRRLSQAWPGSIAFDTLVSQAVADVGAALGPDLAGQVARLEEALIAIFKAGLLDFRLEPPTLTTAVTERPRASAVARWQAQSSREVTDLRHRMVALDGIVVRQFVSLLDGSRTPEMLLAELNAFLDEVHGSGADVGDLPRRATAEEVVTHLKDVARLGLLHP
ncbi:MAG: methyltransferase regulatory domain-containing protein [Bosea sp. (in: a-proteobacteria)]|uniref:methyltransferase regulatory domain-containing protein n=1 Tax=Bosea sp. (in: a-proteobacteria) TaxID=1871050 RepID=UPI002734BAF2|nr:methyltransferase regulatory domain-containing protein [Bosea sp. (in: a-proteobacteria)]MDP3258163.1 methyltransferase regulatory domain-containing protein [Bosea sp. (in: a-proteobacteria)]MDP3321217.1 methyltransferase regulatory domain-containing protein [Bosea sp. (in: a-proteobacteria)]